MLFKKRFGGNLGKTSLCKIRNWHIMEKKISVNTGTQVIIHNHKLLLDMIMESSKDVRFAAISDMNEKILWSSTRTDVKHILTLEETKETLKRAISAWKSRFNITHKVGREMYTITAYDKIKRVTIPLDKDHMLFITLDNECTAKYGKLTNLGPIMSIVDWEILN